MEELTDLLGRDLEKYVLEQNISFIRGYIFKPETDDGNPTGYSITILNEKFESTVKYIYHYRIFGKNLFGELEISTDELNEQQRELVETIGGLLKEFGKSDDERLTPLYQVNRSDKVSKPLYRR